MSQDFPITERTKIKRNPKRATYDKDVVHQIIDEAYICHVGAQMADRPMVQPTAIWRDGDKVYIHGSSKNGLYRALLEEREACITVTHLDGLVLARSAFHHSMNYRSVMIFAQAREVSNPDEKAKILDLLMQKITPDRLDGVRAANPQELKATIVLEFELTEVSAKVRSGGPIDDAEDYALGVWAGVIPLELTKGEALEDQADLNS